MRESVLCSMKRTDSCDLPGLKSKFNFPEISGGVRKVCTASQSLLLSWADLSSVLRDLHVCHNQLCYHISRYFQIDSNQVIVLVFYSVYCAIFAKCLVTYNIHTVVDWTPPSWVMSPAPDCGEGESSQANSGPPCQTLTSDSHKMADTDRSSQLQHLKCQIQKLSEKSLVKGEAWWVAL